MNNPSYAAAINILENSNKSNFVQISESLMNMALSNEPSMDHVDFTANFTTSQMNGEQLPQLSQLPPNQNILGNHQLMNNIGNANFF